MAAATADEEENEEAREEPQAGVRWAAPSCALAGGRGCPAAPCAPR